VTLHDALESAVKWGLLARNVADAVSPPRYQRAQWQTLSEFDLNRLLEAAKKTPYYVLFYQALFTGMRRSELLALRWCDVDLLMCQAHVTRSLHRLRTGEIDIRAPKSARGRRMVALTASSALLFQEHRDRQEALRAELRVPLKDDDLIFSDKEGRPMLPDRVTHAWIKLVRQTGLRGIRLHDARHTHASLMLKQGVHPKVVQERLGHASIQITLDTYSHVAPGLQEAAAAGFDKMVLPKLEKEAVEKNY
jgi:integrase